MLHHSYNLDSLMLTIGDDEVMIGDEGFTQQSGTSSKHTELKLSKDEDHD